MLDSVKEIRPHPLDRPREFDVFVAFNERFEEHSDFEAGERRPETEVGATSAEGDVRIGVASDVEAIGVVEDRRITICRGVPQGYDVAGGDVVPGDIEVFDRIAAEVQHR